MFLSALLALPLALGDLHFGQNDVRTLFVIAKSDNRDQVHFGIHLDADCVPVGNEPVFPYWHINEKGPDVLEELTWLDQKGYGIAGQWVTTRSKEGSKVLVTLKASSERGIAVVVKKRGEDGKCSADAIATIDKAPAKLEKIFVKLRGWLSVDYLDISGWRLPSGQGVVERVKM